MESTEKIEKMKEALEYITTPEIKEFAKRVVESLPDYFFEIPASSTGKYHPNFSLGEGGLYRHTLGIIRLGADVLYTLDMFKKYSIFEKDLAIVAWIAHDGWKRGLNENPEEHTQTLHPKHAVEALKGNENLKGLIAEEQFDILCNAIASHMGQWSKGVLPKPKTSLEKIVHLFDYIVSRKYIEVNFDYLPEKRKQ